MSDTRQRIIIWPFLTVVLILAFQMRITGYKWGIEDNHYYHPDERSIFMDATGIRMREIGERRIIQERTETASGTVVESTRLESGLEYFRRWMEINLDESLNQISEHTRSQNPSLHPRGFHYGTLGWYILAAARPLSGPVHEALLKWENRLAPEDETTVSRFHLKAYETIRNLRQEVPPANRVLDMNQAGRIGRFLSTLFGVATVYLLYLMGARFYNRAIGLLAAILLTYTVTHIQLAHYYAFDPIQGFFVLLALYAMGRLTLSGKLVWYVLGAASIGFSIATKYSSLPLVPMIVLAHFLCILGRPSARVGHFDFRAFRPASLVLGGIYLLYLIVARVTGYSTPYTTSFAALFVTAVFLILLTLLIRKYTTYSVMERISDRDRGAFYRMYAITFPVGLLFTALTRIAPGSFWHLLAGVFLLAAIIVHVYLFHRSFSFARYVTPWVYLVLALWLIPRFVFIGQPFCFINSEKFWRDINAQQLMATTLDHFPFTIQYRQTYPFIYHLEMMFRRTLGYPLAFCALAGTAYLLWKQVRKANRMSILLLVWTIGYFSVVGGFHVKYPRYLISIVPPLVLIAAVFLVDLVSGEAVRVALGKVARMRSKINLTGDLVYRKVTRVRFIGLILLLFTVAYTFSYARGFLRIYQLDHTWKRASYWLYENCPRGSRFLVEHWDDHLPMSYHSQEPRVDPGMYRFNREDLPWYEPDTPDKIYKIADRLAGADYVVLATKRLYGAILRAEERFPYASNYYRLLFSNMLGYELVKVVEQPIEFWGIKLYDDLIDESFRVYDHPKVCIFKRTRDLDPDALAQAIISPPAEIKSLSYNEILTIRDGQLVYEERPASPLLRWYVALFLLGLIAFPFLFPICGGLKDRGYAIAKTMGILLLGYFSWLLPALGIVRFSTTEIYLVGFILGAFALFLYRRQWTSIREFLSANLGHLLLTEVIFLAVFALFIAIRMWNPDIHWGEKPMNFAFLTSIYRSEFFPPLDPWIAGNPINYYYYGFVLLGVLGKLVNVPPEYCFNLAVGTIPALVFISAFSVVRTLTNRKIYGLLGGYFTVMAGNMASFFIAFQNARTIWASQREGARTALNEMAPHFLTAFGTAAPVIPPGSPVGETSFWQGISAWWADVFGVVSMAFGILWNAFRGQPQENLDRFIGFNEYFWKTTHGIITSSVAQEYPMWTYIFADLHAHMVVIPFTLLAIALCVNAARNDRTGIHIWGGGWKSLLGLFLVSLAIGTTLCINSWTFPTLAYLVVLVTALSMWRFRQGTVLSRLRKPYQICESLGGKSRWAKRAYLWIHSLSFDLTLPVIAVIFASVLLFVPFHTNFHPRVPLGKESIRIMTASWTTPGQFAIIFGLFAFILIAYSLVKLRCGSEGRRRWWPLLLFAGGLILSVGAAEVLTRKIEPKDPLQVRMERDTGGTSIPLEIPRSPGLLGQPERWLSRLEFQKTSPPVIPNEPNSEAPQEKKVPFSFHRNLLNLWKHLFQGTYGAPYWGTAALAFPFLTLALILLLRRRGTREENLFQVFLIVGLSVFIGVEFIYIFETWGVPSHRWNTVFKFFMDVWLFLALAAAGAIYFIRNRPRPEHRGPLGWIVSILSRIVFYPVLLLLLVFSLTGTIFGPYSVISSPGAHCNRGERPSLNGLSFVKKTGIQGAEDEYRAIHWLRRFIPGQPTLAEGDSETRPGTTYDNQYPAGRIATYTGIPAVAGWEHHSKERGPSGHLKGRHDQDIHQRRADLIAIYSSENRERTIELLRKHRVQLLFVGVHEIRKYPGCREKFRQYGDVLDLLLDHEYISIYRVRHNMNQMAMAPVLPQPMAGTNASAIDPGTPPAVRAIERFRGASMFDGGVGNRPGEFDKPIGIAIAADGWVAIADTGNHRVQVFDATGQIQAVFGREGEGHQDFREPHSVVFDREGNIVVCDTWNLRLSRYNRQGILQGNMPGPYYGARAVTMNPANGNFYVADTGNHHVKVVAPNGQVVSTIGSIGEQEGQLWEPTGIAIGPNGEIVVAEMLNSRISIFDQQGNFLRTLRPPLGENSGNEMHVAVSKNGHVYITDPMGARIFHYTLDGSLIEQIRTREDANVRVQIPAAVAISPDGHLLVTDREAGKVVQSRKAYP